MAENNEKKAEKKTLGLKPGTLGISKSSGSKLTLAPGAKLGPKPTSSSGSKGSVVVVTKTRGSRGAAASAKPAEKDPLQGLTGAERDRRLHALKLAEQHARQKEEQAASDEDIEVSSTEDEAPASDVVVEEHVEEEAPKIKSRADLKGILSKGKIKNLDSLYKPAKPKEPEPAPTPAEAPRLDPAKKKEAPKPFKKEEEREVATAKRTEDRRTNRKLSVTQVMMMDGEESTGGRRRSMASIKRARDKARRKYEGEQKPAEKVIRDVNIPDVISVQELANRMSEKAADVVKSLMKLGMMVTVNQSIDADTAELVVGEFGHKFKRVTDADIESSLIQKVEDKDESLKPRPPVVTIMGHVDHGKTSLLDALRATDVVAGEAGGITQHIGAYQVTLPSKKVITFLDTPGHEAFTAMRLRGAQVTDIVVLVVAADDGIMEQTKEAISHAKAAEVPIIVAINKIDKPEADPQRVKNELLANDLVPDDMGGDVMVVEVSAKQRKNLDKLEEIILLQAELLELKANPNRIAEGAVVEAKVDKGRGPVATLLVQKGTVKNGDIVVAGTAWGKSRALINDKGQKIKEAGPSTPVEILGLDTAPTAGDEFTIVPDERTAREVVELRTKKEKERKLVASKSSSLDTMFQRAGADGVKELAVLIKADVQGSVEAIANSLQKLATEEIEVKVIHSGVGGVTESDITLASASGAIVLGFNVRANQQARDMAKTSGVDIRYYSVIYNLVDEIKAAMGGMLSPTVKENLIGYAEVRQVINLSKHGKIAGSYVTEGVIKRHAHARLLRDNVVIYEGKLKALKRFKEDAKEVNTGFECGISFENYEDIKEGDIIEAFERTEEARTL